MGKRKEKVPPRIRRASETNEAVDRILGITSEATLSMKDIPDALENVARFRRGLAPVWSDAMLNATSIDERIGIVDILARIAVVDLWKRNGRVAYDVHPEMASSLYRAEMKGKLPGQMLRRLPHISPMIPLPRAWPYKAGNGSTGRILAYFVTGVSGQGFCRTTDSQADGIALMPWIEMLNEETREYDYVVTPVLPLPLMDGSFSLADAVDHINGWHGTTSSPEDRKLLRQVIPGALSVLTYLCCDNRDVQEPSAPSKGKRVSGPPRDPYYVRVGWYVGPKLHAARERATGRTREGVSTPSGVEQGPQHRAGHYKLVHHGQGRQQSSLRWVDPYWTKLDMLKEGEEPVTQIVPVDVQRKDPAGHKSIRRTNLGTAKAKEITEREQQRAREEDWDF